MDTPDGPLPLLALAPGPVLARGREATLYDVGAGRVLRCYDEPRDVVAEVSVMRHVASHGFRVPAVHALQVGAGGNVVGMVLERVDGPTQLAAALAGDVSPQQVGEDLAALHRRLHRVPLTGLHLPGTPAPAGGDVLAHLDLHPANVLLGAGGQHVVIDWTTARPAAPDLDTAMTALTIAATAVAGVPAGAGDVAALAIPAPWLRTLLASYLRALDGPPALEPAADLLTRVGAHAPAAVRAAVDLVRATPAAA